jgi:hypothetical protein
MVLTAFIQAASWKPSTTPESAQWQDKGNPPDCAKEHKASDASAPRWCRHTQAYKPDRAHFDRHGQQVVLRMDHHCIWLNNTFGHGNYKYFLLFLFYTCASCVFCDISFLQILLLAHLPSSTAVFITESLGISCVLSAVLVPFFCFHVWLTSRNMTTLEYYETYIKRSQKSEGEGAWQYDLGLYKNWAEVLGDNPLLWFLPIATSAHDGIHFHRPEVHVDASKCEDDNDDSNGDDSSAMSSGEEPKVEEKWTSASELADDLLSGCLFFGEVALDSAQRLVDISLGCSSSKVGKVSMQRPRETVGDTTVQKVKGSIANARDVHANVLQFEETDVIKKQYVGSIAEAFLSSHATDKSGVFDCSKSRLPSAGAVAIAPASGACTSRQTTSASADFIW